MTSKNRSKNVPGIGSLIAILLLSHLVLGMMGILSGFAVWMPPLAAILHFLTFAVLHYALLVLQFMALLFAHLTKWNFNGTVLLSMPLALLLLALGLFELSAPIGPANQQRDTRSPTGGFSAVHRDIEEDFGFPVRVHAFLIGTVESPSKEEISTHCSSLSTGTWGWGDAGDFWFYCGDDGGVWRFERVGGRWSAGLWNGPGDGPPKSAMPDDWNG